MKILKATANGQLTLNSEFAASAELRSFVLSDEVFDSQGPVVEDYVGLRFLFAGLLRTAIIVELSQWPNGLRVRELNAHIRVIEGSVRTAIGALMRDSLITIDGRNVRLAKFYED